MFTRGDRWEKRATTGRARGGSEGQCLDRRRGCGGAEFRAGVGLEGRDVLERRYGRYGKGRDLREGRGFKQKGVAFERRGVASHSPGAAAPRALAPPAPNPGSPHRDRPPAPPSPPASPTETPETGQGTSWALWHEVWTGWGGVSPPFPPSSIVPDLPRPPAPGEAPALLRGRRRKRRRRRRRGVCVSRRPYAREHLPPAFLGGPGSSRGLLLLGAWKREG